MAQYCRYCSHLVTGNGIYCGEMNKEMSEAQAKRTNTCSRFDLNPIDAFYENEKGYQPREPKPVISDGQITMEDVIKEEQGDD